MDHLQRGVTVHQNHDSVRTSVFDSRFGSNLNFLFQYQEHEHYLSYINLTKYNTPV